MNTGLSDHPLVYLSLQKLFGSYLASDAREILADRYRTKRGILKLFKLNIDPAFIERRLIFIHVPKAAGSALARALYGGKSEHHTAKYYSIIAPSAFHELPSFTVIREPVARTLSAYTHVMNRGGKERALHPGWHKRFSRIHSLSDYLHYVEEHQSNLYDLDTIMRPQVHFYRDDDGTALVKDVFRLGSPELRDFLARQGVMNLERVNDALSTQPTPTAKETSMILRLYADDAEAYYS